jgi:16S rRNA (guanine966-N2)-methyltransferase
VTRIIAGAIGSLQLKPAAKATRPTSDRVKESLFAKLDAMGVIEGARVLDLFAGTGALGLEAASRGAEQVTLVERDRKAFELLQENVKNAKSALAKQGFAPELRAVNVAAQRFLEGDSGGFDLVFLDPPYEIDHESVAKMYSALHLRLNEDALLVFERSSRARFDLPEDLKLLTEKSYGDTILMFIKRKEYSL